MDIIISLIVVFGIAWMWGNLFGAAGKILTVNRTRMRIFFIVLSIALFVTGIILINTSALSIDDFVRLDASGPLWFIVVLCFVLAVASYHNSRLYRWNAPELICRKGLVQRNQSHAKSWTALLWAELWTPINQGILWVSWPFPWSFPELSRRKICECPRFFLRRD